VRGFGCSAPRDGNSKYTRRRFRGRKAAYGVERRDTDLDFQRRNTELPSEQCERACARTDTFRACVYMYMAHENKVLCSVLPRIIFRCYYAVVVCGVWCTRSRSGSIVTFFVYRPPISRPLGSLTPTLRLPSPGGSLTRLRATPGPPWEAPQAECRSLTGVSPSHRPIAPGHATARALAQPTAGPGQRLPPCMCSGGMSGNLLSTSPERARAI